MSKSQFGVSAANTSNMIGATNFEGAPTHVRSLEEQVLQVLTTNTLGATFYATQNEVSAITLSVLQRAVRECPEFLAKALVYARTTALLKAVPVVGLVVLSTARDKGLFEAVFDRVILIPDDLRTFVEWSKSGKIRGRKGFGGCVVAPVRRWLTRMSEYHTVKYGSSASKGFSLQDIIRLSHPKTVDPAGHERLGWLRHSWDEIGPAPSPTNPKIWALEALKRTTSEDETIRLITEFGLPYEVVVPAVSSMSTRVWEALMKVAPYFNMVRSLNTYARHGVFENPANVEYVVSRLTNPNAVAHSRVLPLRFHSAFKAYTANVGHNLRIAQALSDALDLMFVNMPEFPLGTRIAIAPDVSGSMSSLISEKSETMIIEIASIYAAALLKKTGPDAVLLPFDTELHSVPLTGSESLLGIANRISLYGGGGTSVGLPVQYLLDRKIVVDACIGITDSEDWAYGDRFGCSGSFLTLWRKYRQNVNRNAQAFLITVVPYTHAVAPKDEPNVHYISGWSDAVVEYIPRMLQLGLGQVEEVRRMSL